MRKMCELFLEFSSPSTLDISLFSFPQFITLAEKTSNQHGHDPEVVAATVRNEIIDPAVGQEVTTRSSAQELNAQDASKGPLPPNYSGRVKRFS